MCGAPMGCAGWCGVVSSRMWCPLGKRANNEKQTWLWHEVRIFAVTLAPAHDLRTVAMNQPSRAEKFVLPDGVRKLTFTRDTKVANAGTYVVQKEDHTLGNIVRMCVPVPIVPPLHRVEPASTSEPTR